MLYPVVRLYASKKLTTPTVGHTERVLRSKCCVYQPLIRLFETYQASVEFQILKTAVHALKQTTKCLL